jgi:hypothetical protein
MLETLEKQEKNHLEQLNKTLVNQNKSYQTLNDIKNKKLSLGDVEGLLRSKISDNKIEEKIKAMGPRTRKVSTSATKRKFMNKTSSNLNLNKTSSNLIPIETPIKRRIEYTSITNRSTKSPSTFFALNPKAKGWSISGAHNKNLNRKTGPAHSRNVSDIDQFEEPSNVSVKKTPRGGNVTQSQVNRSSTHRSTKSSLQGNK